MSSYRSIVLVKQVPDTSNITGSAMKEDGTVNRAALPTIFNPEDLSALEAALEVKDRFGGTVTVVSMGPPKAADVLRDCLYRGADRAILVTDRRAGGSDTLATSYILSQAVKTVGEFDFVFCERRLRDASTRAWQRLGSRSREAPDSCDRRRRSERAASSGGDSRYAQ